MKNYRAYLLGGVCLGLVSAQVSGVGPWTIPSAQAEDAAAGPSGTTSYYGDIASPESPAWAGEATMSPDYSAEAAAAEPSAEAPATAEPAGEESAAEEPAAAEPAGEESAAEEPAAAEPAGEESAAEEPAAAEPAATVAEELPMTPPGVTSYYGDTAPSEAPAWAAEATMNPDYSAEAAAPAAEPAATEPAAEAPAAAEAPSTEPAADEEPAAEAPAATEPAATVAEELPMTPPGVTSYYGDTAPSEAPAWAAEAAMNPDYSAEPAAAEQPAAEAPAAEAPSSEPAPTEEPAVEAPAAAEPSSEPATTEEPKEEEGFWKWLTRKIFG